MTCWKIHQENLYDFLQRTWHRKNEFWHFPYFSKRATFDDTGGYVMKYPVLAQSKPWFSYWTLHLVRWFPLFSYEFPTGSALSSHAKMVDSRYFPIASPFSDAFPMNFPIHFLFKSPNSGGRPLARPPKGPWQSTSFDRRSVDVGRAIFFGEPWKLWDFMGISWKDHGKRMVSWTFPQLFFVFFDGHIRWWFPSDNFSDSYGKWSNFS